MTTVGKPTGRAKSMPVGLALGGAVALTITLTLCALGAKLLDGGTLKETAIGYWVMGVLLISPFAGSMVASVSIQRRRLLVCGLSSAIYFGCLISMTALFFGGEYRGVGVTALMVLCGGGLAAMALTRQGRGGRHRHRLRHR